MKKLLLFLAIGLTLPTFAADSWITWRPLNAGFSVLLPAPPKFPSPGPGQWQTFDEEKRLYGVVVQGSTPGLEPTQEQLLAIMDGVVQQSNATVKDKSFFKYKDFPAFEFKLATLSSQISVTRIISTPHHRYVLSFVSNTRKYDDGVRKKFFDSLQFTLSKTNI